MDGSQVAELGPWSVVCDNMLAQRVRSFSVARRVKIEQPRALALGTLVTGNRPERATDWWALFPKTTFLKGESIRTPFQGEFVVPVVPGAEAPTPQNDSTELAEVLRRGTRFQDTGAPKGREGGLGCTLFALRTMLKRIRYCPNRRRRPLPGILNK
jgi:hypothetical protein